MAPLMVLFFLVPYSLKKLLGNKLGKHVNATTFTLFQAGSGYEVVGNAAHCVIWHTLLGLCGIAQLLLSRYLIRDFTSLIWIYVL